MSHVYLADVAAYARSILASRQPIAGVTVTLDLTQTAAFIRPSVNIYPFVIALMNRPEIRLKVVCEQSFEQSYLVNNQRQRLFRPLPRLETTNFECFMHALIAKPVTQAQRLWATYCRSVVKELWVTPDQEPWLEVVLKPKGFEWWMESPSAEVAHLSLWFARTGCPVSDGEGKWGVRIRGVD